MSLKTKDCEEAFLEEIRKVKTSDSEERERDMEINREYPLYTQTDEKKREHGTGHGGSDGGGRRDVTPTEIFMGYR